MTYVENQMHERTRLESELADLELIANSPLRRRVSQQETLSVPYRWVCLLKVKEDFPTNKNYNLSTGVLVGPRHVLTAAHVLVNEYDPSKTVGDKITVQICPNGPQQIFDPVRIRGWSVHPKAFVKLRGKWVRQSEFDFGLITLKDAVAGKRHSLLGGYPLSYWGDLGTPGLKSKIGIPITSVNGIQVLSAGYPGDLPPGTMWKGSGNVTVARNKLEILHTINTLGGQSGSPIWTMDNGQACLIGIHTGPGHKAQAPDGSWRYINNEAVLITPSVSNMISSWKKVFAR